MAHYLITRSPSKAQAISQALKDLDAEAVFSYAPLLEAVGLEPEDWEEAAYALIRGDFSWVTFTSVNGVLALEALASGLGLPLAQLLGAAQLAAVGRATEQALTDRGLLVDFVPDTQSAAGMLEDWPLDPEEEDPLASKVLAVQGITASPVLAQGLADYGYTVATLPVYDMQPYPADQPLTGRQAQDDQALTGQDLAVALDQTQVLLATSPLLLKTLAAQATKPLPATVVIGASTQAAARELADSQRPAQISLAASPAPADLAAAAYALATAN